MLGRLIDAWLAETTERSFQVPVSHILAFRGYEVFHVTRHCGFELGKDILAKDENGICCAFQLKTAKNGRVRLKDFRGFQEQVWELLHLTIEHPAIGKCEKHRSFLLTNGIFEEEVITAVNQLNQKMIDSGYPDRTLEFITGTQLRKWALKSLQFVWPASDNEEIRTFLNIYLTKGENMLPKEELSRLLDYTFELSSSDPNKYSKRKHIEKAISCGLLTHFCLKEFSNKKNYYAEIEAWVIFLAYLFAYSIKFKTGHIIYNNLIDICQLNIYNSMYNLCQELKEREYYDEGNVLFEFSLTYRSRLSLLVGMLSAFGLWRIHTLDGRDEIDAFVSDFTREQSKNILLWGEAAVPLFLSYYWYARATEGTFLPENLLVETLSAIVKLKDVNFEAILPNPYLGIEDALENLSIVEADKRKDSFKLETYTAEAIINLLARRRRKVAIKNLWADISRIWFASFMPSKKWHYFRWNNDEGVNYSEEPKYSKDWLELLTESDENEGKSLPTILKSYPLFFLLFICVFPHRLGSDAVRWFDNWHSETFL